MYRAAAVGVNVAGDHILASAAAIALEALSSDELQAANEHMRRCQACAEAVAVYRHFAAAMAFSVTSYRAPAELYEAVIADAPQQVAEAAAKIEDAEAAPRPPRPHHRAGTRRSARRSRGWSLRRFFFWTVPWAAALLGWIAAAALVLYDHGVSDRLADTRINDQSQLAVVTAERDTARAIQDFLFTPGVVVSPMTYQAGTARHTNVTLFSAPGYIHGVVAARGLVPLPNDKIYCIWARTLSGAYVSLGTLITAGVRAQGVSIVVGPEPLDQYPAIGISIEWAPAPSRPHSPLIFLLKQRFYDRLPPG